MAKILITGGAGFIGSHTVDLALKEGHEVTVYDVKTWIEATDLHHLPKGAINYISGNIVDYELLEASLEGHTHVLHLAAMVSVQETIDYPLESHLVNVSGTLNVFEAARRIGLKRVVYASSAAVYGDNNEIVSETTTCNPLSPYGLHKLISDEYARLYCSLYNQSMLGLRYFNVFGPRQKADSPYSGVISIFTTKAKSGGTIFIYGDGLSSRDFISVYDVARANLLALMSSSTGHCNIAYGQETTIGRLIEIMERILSCTIQKEYKPGRVGDILRSASATVLAKESIGFESKMSLEEGLRELLV